MLESKTVLKVVKNEKDYQFFCENSSSLGEVYDVLCEMRGFVVNRMNEQQAADCKKEEQPVEQKAE